jgi:hypothetical protein
VIKQIVTHLLPSNGREKNMSVNVISNISSKQIVGAGSEERSNAFFDPNNNNTSNSKNKIALLPAVVFGGVVVSSQIVDAIAVGLGTMFVAKWSEINKIMQDAGVFATPADWEKFFTGKKQIPVSLMPVALKIANKMPAPLRDWIKQNILQMDQNGAVAPTPATLPERSGTATSPGGFPTPPNGEDPKKKDLEVRQARARKQQELQNSIKEIKANDNLSASQKAEELAKLELKLDAVNAEIKASDTARDAQRARPHTQYELLTQEEAYIESKFNSPEYPKNMSKPEITFLRARLQNIKAEILQNHTPYKPQKFGSQQIPR